MIPAGILGIAQVAQVAQVACEVLWVLVPIVHKKGDYNDNYNKIHSFCLSIISKIGNHRTSPIWLSGLFIGKKGGGKYW